MNVLRSLALFAIGVFCGGAVMYGVSQSKYQAAVDSQQEANRELQQQVAAAASCRNEYEDLQARDRQTITQLTYEAKTNAWPKYFAAQQQVNDLKGSNAADWQATQASLALFQSCKQQQAQISQARQVQQTQGMEAALRVLALLLR